MPEMTDYRNLTHFPLSNIRLPFSEYIAHTRILIESRRQDLPSNIPREKIINANLPFQLSPTHPIKNGERIKYGVLLIHGLFDSPFSMRDLSIVLQTNGILCRSILLPGHGTKPSDLLHISYHDWIQAVRYGIESLRHEVDYIYLAGYSTGAALSIHQALQDSSIAGIILLAPAIQIRAPVDILIAWEYGKKLFRYRKDQWLTKNQELDYAKYSSFTINAIVQVAKLTSAIGDLQRHHTLSCPILMIQSQNDETISSHKAIEFFTHFHHPNSQLILYSTKKTAYQDSRIQTKNANFPAFHIQNFSHICIPFSPDNVHYGKQGDYINASHPDKNNKIYGGYTEFELNINALSRKFKFTQTQKEILTYNPDFNEMANNVVKFICAQ